MIAYTIGRTTWHSTLLVDAVIVGKYDPALASEMALMRSPEWYRYSLLASDPSRTDDEEREVHALLAGFLAAGHTVDVQITDREP